MNKIIIKLTILLRRSLLRYGIEPKEIAKLMDQIQVMILNKQLKRTLN